LTNSNTNAATLAPIRAASFFWLPMQAAVRRKRYSGEREKATKEK